MVEYTFDVLGGAGLRVTSNDGGTPLLMLEADEGTDDAEPETLAHLRRLLAIPDEQPAQLCAHKRLALVTAIHTRIGAASPLAELVEPELLQIICRESGRRSKRETYAHVARWIEATPALKEAAAAAAVVAEVARLALTEQRRARTEEQHQQIQQIAQLLAGLSAQPMPPAGLAQAQ